MPNTSLRIQQINLQKLTEKVSSYHISRATFVLKEGYRLLFIGFGKVTRHVLMDPAMPIVYSRQFCMKKLKKLEIIFFHNKLEYYSLLHPLSE